MDRSLTWECTCTWRRLTHSAPTYPSPDLLGSRPWSTLRKRPRLPIGSCTLRITGQDRMLRYRPDTFAKAYCILLRFCLLSYFFILPNSRPHNSCTHHHRMLYFESTSSHALPISVNKQSGEFLANDDVLSASGHKWTLETLFQHLHDVMHINTDDIWTRICDCVVKVRCLIRLWMSVIGACWIGKAYETWIKILQSEYIVGRRNACLWQF